MGRGQAGLKNPPRKRRGLDGTRVGEVGPGPSFIRFLDSLPSPSTQLTVSFFSLSFTLNLPHLLTHPTLRRSLAPTPPTPLPASLPPSLLLMSERDHRRPATAHTLGTLKSSAILLFSSPKDSNCRAGTRLTETRTEGAESLSTGGRERELERGRRSRVSRGPCRECHEGHAEDVTRTTRRGLWGTRGTVTRTMRNGYADSGGPARGP